MKKYFLLLPLLIFLDLFLKYITVNFLPLEGIYLFKDWLGLGLFYNKAIAFSIPIPLLLLYIVNTIIIVILFYLLLKKMKSSFALVRYQAIALIVLLSGALANLIDRIYNGYVIDYIVVAKFPVFNLADILVVCGAFSWLILEYFLDKKNKSL